MPTQLLNVVKKVNSKNQLCIINQVINYYNAFTNIRSNSLKTQFKCETSFLERHEHFWKGAKGGHQINYRIN